MPKSRGAYPPEFRRQMVELVRAGRTPEELAGEFDPHRKRPPPRALRRRPERRRCRRNALSHPPAPSPPEHIAETTVPDDCLLKFCNNTNSAAETADVIGNPTPIAGVK